MTDITNDPLSSQFPESGRFPVMGYRSLAPDQMRAVECLVAQRILQWMNACEFPYYRDYIALVTEDVFGSQFMDDLAFGLWRHTDASMWLRHADAASSRSMLWQYAILRASQLLNLPA